MPDNKVKDEEEAKRWLREGKTYPWIIAKYQEKYKIKTSKQMWSNRSARWGLDPRLQRYDTLIPWRVLEEHGGRYHIQMLRCEGRLRAGLALTPEQVEDHARFRANLAEYDAVVRYRRDKGFDYVYRRQGIDLDLIHEPAPRDRSGRKFRSTEGAVEVATLNRISAQ